MTEARSWIVVSLVVVALTSGCSKPPPETSEAGSAGAMATADAAAGAAVVVGRTPPAVNGVPSIVILEPSPERAFPPPEEKPVMDQVSEMFMPPVLFVQTGQPVEFRNSDEKLHNINVKEDASKDQLFNVAIPMGGTYERAIPREGLYNVHCDIHPAMAALIVSAPTPYAKMAEADGMVQFDGVAPGTYKLVVYAGTAKLEQPVEVTVPRTEFTVKN